MHYLKLPHMDGPVSIFDICQAHQQLESDYSHGGWLRERPSNQRRNGSTSCQLLRMRYRDPGRWVDICPNYPDDDGDNDQDDNDVRDIYLINVLKLGLPMDDQMRAFTAARYVPEFLAAFPSWSKK